MLALDLLDLHSSNLQSPDVILGGTSIFQGSTDFRQNYWGSFTYTHDASGNLSVHGQVTGYSLYEYSWDGDDRYISYGFEIRELSLDVAELVGLTDAQVLERMLAGDDSIEGSQSNDHLVGFDGDDRLYGYHRPDTLDGGAGADTMYGGYDPDLYVINDPGDVVREFSFDGPFTDTVHSIVDFQLSAHVEDLVLLGDAIRGWGNASANVIEGNTAANVLRGGQAADTVAGGNGADRLHGGAGADVLSGGDGRDTFVYQSAADSREGDTDRITDFQSGGDLIRLDRMDADVALAGSQQFTFIGRAAFDRGAAAGQLRFVYDSATNMGMLLGSTDADRFAEFVVHLPGVSRLVLSDLLI
ncbi:MAG: beta-lactamase [Ramlibacter sp.]|jgi:Ca2+-binding RTX toxin-like protein|nr:beta-lactamase [Ramlibacter sp.]